jgi:hypothetical protein
MYHPGLKRVKTSKKSIAPFSFTLQKNTGPLFENQENNSQRINASQAIAHLFSCRGFLFPSHIGFGGGTLLSAGGNVQNEHTYGIWSYA